MNEGADVFCVVLAGGSGTRFWPASRRLRPKQLLPLGPAAPQSLIRRTVDRLARLAPKEQILISTGTHLIDATLRELPSLERGAILAEPLAKNTAPCIAWAAAVVAGRNPDAIICALPSDQHAADEAAFVAAMKDAVEAARQGYITTLGIVPTRPETGYGYIERGERRGEVELVGRFVEKPDRSTAEQYIESGRYLWNAGIFVFRAADMLDAVERHLPEVHSALERFRGQGFGDAAACQSYFESCPSISIDYGVMERAERLAVVPAEFGWSDLGSWESAWELGHRDDQGNSGPEGTIWIDARNNLVEDLRTPDGRVIALVGVSDLCVVQTEDALLVMPRERSQDVRQVVDALKSTGRGAKVESYGGDQSQ